MPANDGTETRRNRIEVKVNKVVDDIEPSLCELNNFEIREGLRPLSLIDIAPHCHHGCYCSQTLNYVRITNIPGMYYQVGVFQSFKCFWPNQTVSIGYYSD
jgi:hypothetical protein